MTDRSPQQIADHVCEGMFANDRASKALGMRIDAVNPGEAVLVMTVRDDMLNGHDICHGGLIAMLADSAFAFACNSYDELTVASGFAIDLLAPARLGDVLTARCHEVSRAGRTGVYDTDVSNQRGERIAVFRGRSYTIKGKPAVPPLA
jgi:acyl-CoA thioesterase